MRLSQKMAYIVEQLNFLEESIVDKSQAEYLKAFEAKNIIDATSLDGMRVAIYQHFKYYERPLLARYMIVIQLYSIFERYSVYFSKLISKKELLLKINDLNGK